MELTVRQWIEKYKNGEFDNSNFETQLEAGWYDWFCDQNELSERLKKMAEIVLQVTNKELLDNYHLRFYNNYPISYPLYDEIVFMPNKNYLRSLAIDIDCPYSTEKYFIRDWTIRTKAESHFNTTEELVNFLNHWQ